MDKTRKLSAVLSDDELFKQKALEYFTAADQNESGTLSDEEVLELCRRISERGHFKMPSADKIKELLGKCDRACDGAIRAVDAPTLAADEDDSTSPVFSEAQKVLGAAAVALAIISLKFCVWDVTG